MTDSDCVFCGIVAGEADALVVDDRDGDGDRPGTLAFAPLDPIAPGHVLVIPKTHYASLFDVPADVLAAVTTHARDLARGLCESADGFDGANLFHDSGTAAAQAVAHLHVHVVGRRDDDAIAPWPTSDYDGSKRDAFDAVRAALDAD